MTYQAVHFNVSFPQQFVAHVEINRPSKMNCFLAAMWLELRAIFDQMSYDPDIRSIIFSGSGNRAFTAGLDVREAGSEGILNNREGLDPGRRAKTIRKDVREIQDCVSSIERCEKRKSLPRLQEALATHCRSHNSCDLHTQWDFVWPGNRPGLLLRSPHLLL